MRPTPEQLKWASEGPHSIGDYAGNYTTEEAKEAIGYLTAEVLALQAEQAAHKKEINYQVDERDCVEGIAKQWAERAEKAETEVERLKAMLTKEIGACEELVKQDARIKELEARIHLYWEAELLQAQKVIEAKDQEIDKLKEIVIRHQHNDLENERQIAAKDQEVERLMERDGQWKVKWEKQVDAHAQSILNDEKQIASIKMELTYPIVAKLVAKNTRIKELEAEIERLKAEVIPTLHVWNKTKATLSRAMSVVEAAKELRLRPSCVMETQAIGLCEHTECKLYDALAAFEKEVKK